MTDEENPESMAVNRLFVYGSLQPGGSNAHVLADVGGDWLPATLKGRLIEAGWGAGMGYPGVVIDPRGDDVGGFVLSSPSLPVHWDRLDAFEGAEYERRLASVALEDGTSVRAWVYALRRGEP